MSHFADFVRVKIIDYFADFGAIQDYESGKVKIIGHFCKLWTVKKFDKTLIVKSVCLDKYY